MHWPEPVMAESTAADGPVLIKIEYRVAAAERLNFIALMRQLAGGRRRHGGYGWTLRQDAGDRECFFETWHEASWLEHRRHHRRVTADDHRLQNEIAALQVSEDYPKVQHLLTPAPESAEDEVGQAPAPARD